MSISAKRVRTVWLLAAFVGPSTVIAQKSYIGDGATGEITLPSTLSSQPPITYLWREPRDISSENLLYGRGGQEHQPHGPFTFESEDLDGTNPKFDVRDSDGVKWKIKLGAEARPETAASRFLWAVGYHTDEDYFLPVAQVNGMPEHVHRGGDMIEPGGVMRNVRLKREEGEKKAGNWSWKDNPFAGTREMYGLRVMMAVINNWDLKDENNAIRDYKKGDENGDTREYEVSDLGASFGTTGRELSHTKSKGNLESYARSTFIAKERQNSVDFDVPSRPALIVAFNTREYVERNRMRWIGETIPREHARWIGDLLGQLSQDQIRDAFRAAGYDGEELNGFVVEFQKRIAALKRL
jgi:hypothetical protein